MTSMNQSIYDSMDYLPFGEQIAGDTGATHKFTGKERDIESGLDDFGARYYDSSLGRFTSPDEFTGGPIDLFEDDDPTSSALPYADIFNPQSLNKYSYTYNSPLRYVDPTGHDPADGSSATQEIIDATMEEIDKVAGPLVESAVEKTGSALAVASKAVGFGFGVLASLATSPAANANEQEMLNKAHTQAAQNNPAQNKGQDFKKKTKEQIDKKNAEENGGTNKCKECKRDVKPIKNLNGVPTSANQLQRHHIKPKREGGSGEASNGEILCPGCHKKKHKKNN